MPLGVLKNHVRRPTKRNSVAATKNNTTATLPLAIARAHAPASTTATTQSIGKNVGSALADCGRSVLLATFGIVAILWNAGHASYTAMYPTLTAGVVIDAWRETPMLSNGDHVPLPIPLRDSATTVTVTHGNVTLIVLNEQAEASTDAALANPPALDHVLHRLGLRQHCHDHPDTSLIVEVGSWRGNFGLGVALTTQCRVVVYEAQEDAALRMAQALMLPYNHVPYDLVTVPIAYLVRIRNAAVSSKSLVSFAAAGGEGEATSSTTEVATTKISTQQLDDEWENILLLKIDVEGGEDDVLGTASRLMQSGKIRHAVLEYTPFQFAGRGTNYATLLARLYDTHATCYVMHASLPKLWRIDTEDIDTDRETSFYQVLYQGKVQTDLYCTWLSRADDVFYETTDIWTPASDLQNGVGTE